MTQFEDVLETILEEYSRRDSGGEFDTLEETDAFVKKKAEVLLAYVKEEPVSEELEKIVEEIAEPTILNAYGTKELARRLRNTICCTSISEDLEEAMQYNAPDNIGIDDLLYWRNGFIAGANWQKTKDSIVSEDLETELNKYIKDHFTIDKEQLDRFGIEEKDYMYSMDKSDMEKMVRYFTGNYKIPVSDDLEEAAKLYVSDSLCITGEEDWDDAAIEALNAYKAGAKWQKEQVMAKAKSGTVQKNNQAILDNGTYIDLDPSMQLKPSFVGLKEGDRIKIIIIKED